MEREIIGKDFSKPLLPRRDYAVLRINMPHALLFVLKCVSWSKRKTLTNATIHLFQNYDSSAEIKPKSKYFKMGRTPAELFEKYFVHFYAFPRRDWIRSASHLRRPCIVTNKPWLISVKRLAFMHFMKTNDFVVQIL